MLFTLNGKVTGKVRHRDIDYMELKVKGKFVTSSKVKFFQNPSCPILEKIKYFFGSYDALKIYGAPKLCTVMY